MKLAQFSHPFLEDWVVSLESLSKTEPCFTVAGGFKDFHSDPWGKWSNLTSIFFNFAETTTISCVQPLLFNGDSPESLSSSPPPRKFIARGTRGKRHDVSSILSKVTLLTEGFHPMWISVCLETQRCPGLPNLIADSRHPWIDNLKFGCFSSWIWWISQSLHWNWVFYQTSIR